MTSKPAFPWGDCSKCEHRWYPRARGEESRCPRCGSDEVQITRLFSRGALLIVALFVGVQLLTCLIVAWVMAE